MARYVVQVLAVIATGLASGAVLLIGLSSVPFWQGLEPTEFYEIFVDEALEIHRAMYVLGIPPLLMTVAAAIASWRRGGAERRFFAGAAISMLATIAIYPFYFSEANPALMSGSVPLSEIGAELVRWESWHWARVAFGTLAFVLAVLGLSNRAAQQADAADRPSAGS